MGLREVTAKPLVDWNSYFEDAINLNYRLLVSYGNTYLLTETVRINVNDIPDFYNLKGENLDVPEWQKARFRRGYWLELAVNVALRKAKISFKGNSMNPNHYPHSQGLHVDFDSENLLIESTNIKKWLGFDNWQEKIDYFFKADPKHRKMWVLVTTSLKCIPKQIRQQIANNNITLLLTEQVANSRNHNVITDQLVQPLLNLNQQQIPIINNTKNRYQTSTVNSNSTHENMCVLGLEGNKSGLDG